jgi:ABC-2 type transport system permease protein
MKQEKIFNWRVDLRIIWAITAKDILEAVKNRYAIGVLIPAVFIAIAYSFMPYLTSLDNPTNVLVYDAGDSPLSTQLKNDQALEVYTYPSKQIMLERLAHGEVPELGLVIPASFNQSLTSETGSQREVELTGYVLYWVSNREIDKLSREVETEISRLAGKPVQIRVAEDRLIPNPDQHSLGNWVGIALVFLVIYTSLGLISNLMLEEKHTRTLESLMVSPARTWHLVLAKAITGLFYCLLGIAVTLAINQKIVLHWWIIVPTLLLGALFSISLGLIAGSIIEERGQLSLWTFGLLIPLFVPVVLYTMNELFPLQINQAILLIPSVTFFHLLQTSFSWIPSGSALLKQLAWLAAWAIAGLAGAIWIIHRQQLKVMGDRTTFIVKVGSLLRSAFRLQESPPVTSIGNNAPVSSPQGIQTLGFSRFTARHISWLGIVRTIALKDIRVSIHNKLIISILLGTTLLVLGNALLLRGLSTYTGLPANLVGSSVSVLSIMISISLMALGITLVPLLILEEKETHTLETLLVSPARYMQVVTAKALAGSVYCLIATLVILIAYHFLIIHWELALLALLLGTAFIVAVGLLIGMLSNNPTMIGIWAALIVLALIIPAAVAGLGSLDRLPGLKAIMIYWPSTAIIKLLNLAMMVDAPYREVIGNASVLMLAAIALYIVTWWRVRCSDQ